jgi:hypothetical protein
MDNASIYLEHEYELVNFPMFVNKETKHRPA